MHELDFHPLANAFPGLAEEALLELAHDIEAHGQLEPIVLFEGRILDGRQRWLACRMAGVEPQMIDWPGPGEPVAWVISKNLRRRHLSDSQRAMVAARLANLSWGQNKREVQICTSGRDVTRDEAAALLNVSARSVAYARKLQASGDQELQAAVDRGEVSLHDAMSAAELPPDAQREALRAQRSGQARTLRAAVGAASCRFTDEQNQAQAAPRDASPSVGEAPANEPPSIAEVCEALERELGKFARRLDELALARGGDDELAQLARRGLSIV
ncbi:MAG TPA: ParB/RepB/Spo0J family partition protein, partial [Pirellulales bacterium]|nr:ParB/RepB/Spo0J family partition protein [Pirellulales bacterium]